MLRVCGLLLATISLKLQQRNRAQYLCTASGRKRWSVFGFVLIFRQATVTSNHLSIHLGTNTSDSVPVPCYYNTFNKRISAIYPTDIAYLFSISFGTFLIRIFKKKFMQKSLLLPLRRGRQTRDYTYAGEYCWGHTEIAKRNKANCRC